MRAFLLGAEVIWPRYAASWYYNKPQAQRLEPLEEEQRACLFIISTASRLRWALGKRTDTGHCKTERWQVPEVPVVFDVDYPYTFNTRCAGSEVDILLSIF